MPGSTLKVTAPYDEHLIKELPLTTMEEAEKLLQKAYALHQDRSKWLPKFERIKILKLFGEILSENVESLARQAAEEGGKPLVDSIIEVNRAVTGLKSPSGNSVSFVVWKSRWSLMKRRKTIWLIRCLNRLE